MAEGKSNTGLIIGIVAGVAALGVTAWLLLKPKSTSVVKNPATNSGVKATTKPSISNPPNATQGLDIAGIAGIAGLIKQLLGGVKGGVNSGVNGGSSSTSNGWVKDKDGYLKSPNDGNLYWDNGNGTITLKGTGDIYDSKTGDFIGKYLEDGTWFDTQGNLFDSITGNQIGYLLADGTISDMDGNYYDADWNFTGSDNGDGTWTDNYGAVWANNAGVNDKPLYNTYQEYIDDMYGTSDDSDSEDTEDTAYYYGNNDEADYYSRNVRNTVGSMKKVLNVNSKGQLVIS